MLDGMRFSERTAWDLAESELAAKVRAARVRGLVDLTVSNPTECGFGYDAAELLGALGDARALVYEPAALGMARAREAVAGYYGAGVDVSWTCLTTSTSEGYSWLFRVLCDVGDEVLVARPSYPLFDFIGRLDGVTLVEYPLLYDAGWMIDFHGLEKAITERTRAVVVVHPNNPTGNFVSEAERVRLLEICARRGLALVVDEVFLDYAVEGVKARSFVGESKALTFVLSGLSKVCGLPQMKVSWIVANGPEVMVREAIARLEMVADTFLSMNAPMQFALPGWLAGREGIQGAIRERVKVNLAALEERVKGTQAELLVMEGGWTAVLRVPRHVGGVGFVEAALERGVFVQPGEFYGLPEGRVVLSLLTPVEEWRRGLALLPIE